MKCVFKCVNTIEFIFPGLIQVNVLKVEIIAYFLYFILSFMSTSSLLTLPGNNDTTSLPSQFLTPIKQPFQNPNLSTNILLTKNANSKHNHCNIQDDRN